MNRRFKNTDFYQKHKYRLERANDLLSFFSALCLSLFLAGDQSYMALKRHAMSNEIKITAAVTGLYSGVFKIDENVTRAMARVPRHHLSARITAAMPILMSPCRWTARTI